MKIHCIGIGGIGLSALARYYKSQGHEVSGSDSAASDLTKALEKEGVIFYQGHDASHVTEDVAKVVYSIAVLDTNPEYEEAKKRGLELRTYPEALGEVTKEKTTIAICGTHGKTTTTAMTYYAMKACGIRPTVIVGSLLAEGGTNFIAGDSDYLIVEACEYKRSFLNLHPTHVIVTNIDADHLDYYKDIDDIRSAFQSFVEKLDSEGVLVTHPNVTLSTSAKHIAVDAEVGTTISLSVPGTHNRENASLVLTLLKSLGLDEEKIRKGLLSFPGTWRRMEYKGTTKAGIAVYDDYGHHPAEILATHKALREKFPKGEWYIVMLFQPHLYSRTKVLLSDFVEVLSEVDEVYILPIYKARLEDDTVINQDIVVEAINTKGGNAKKLDSLSLIASFVNSYTREKTVIVNMGAGNAFEEINKIDFV
ncbi:MAG: UDP-N-acetylmuramate--L-alanine ligase, UDP-N-acetylmuramate--alanine ligase [Candidatus Parcubacteria bacterium]|jgi:UDP-N-acetylmuramate--alanine ligase